MQEIINQILEGNFEYDNGSLDFSCTKLELAIQKGCCREGSFRIYSDPTRVTRGFITTSDARMECLTTEFSGSDEEISFCFHGENMEEGDVVKGSFFVVSNQGEYYLPFVVSVEHTVLESSIGPIKNLFHFANLVKSNWEEGLNLFYSPEFRHILTGNEAQYYDLYRGLSCYPGNEQNMEEFLICINKKQRVEFLTEEESIQMEDPYGVAEYELGIVRNGWGYTHLNVACEGEFLFTEKQVITEDDFLGNHYRLPVFVDSDVCHGGRNYGMVTLYNSHVTLQIPVVVRVGERVNAGRLEATRKQAMCQLMECYREFRLKHINTASWLKKTGALVERLVALDEKDVAARLFQAQVLITEERYNEASWILDHVVELLEEMDEPAELYAYYLYLNTLIHTEEGYVRQAGEEVYQLYKENRTSWRIAWLLPYISEEYGKSANKRWMLLEHQFEYGCTSQAIYLEALNLLTNNPALLRKLGEFELQVLLFGVKYSRLHPNLVEQVLYLAGKLKNYSPILHKILEKMYEYEADVRVLQELCTQFIKGGKTGAKYAKWYRLGVEAQLRVTKLYEYYCMSLDMDSMQEELPRTLLMYFSYQNNMDYERSAYLYDYLYRHREDDPELYGSYQMRIEYFVREQIQKGHINRNLANLYQELLQPNMITQEMAEPLSKLLFAHAVRVENPNIRKVLVYQPGNQVPTEYLLQDGRAWVAIYGSEYTLLLEDAYGNRFANGMEYTMEKLMRPGKYLKAVQTFSQSNLAFDLLTYDNEKNSDEMTAERCACCKRLLQSDRVDVAIRKEIYFRLLAHYYEIDNIQALDELLGHLDSEGEQADYLLSDAFTLDERNNTMKYMVVRERFDEAYQWMLNYGPYFVDPKILVSLISRMIENANFAPDTVLLAAAHYVFERGKYNGTVLRYLSLYYQGTTKAMRDVWKAATSFDVDCYELCEQILVQMLYTGAYIGEKMEVFRFYISQGAKPEIESAFLAQCAYDYFVKERVTESYVFQQLRYMYQRGEEIQKVCKLAFLKYYAENRAEMTPEVEPVILAFLREMLDRGIHLNLFWAFKDLEVEVNQLQDKVIVEYKADPRSKARIHYLVVQEGADGDYSSEYMQEAYGGVYFKEFILFFGESLQYYIVEEGPNGEELTESGTAQKSDIHSGDTSGKYNLINDIVISKSLQDYDTMDNLMEEYYRKECWNEELFRLM